LTRKPVPGANTALKYGLVETDLGWIGVAGGPAGLVAVTHPLASPGDVELELQRFNRQVRMERDDGAFEDVLGQVVRHFRGERVEFRVELDPTLGTPFQREVWRALRSLPYGSTASYGWIARQVGRPKGPRAVGQAVGSNPWPIIVPCHRVLAGDGTLGGFGGGLALKRALLKLEGVEAVKDR